MRIIYTFFVFIACLIPALAPALDKPVDPCPDKHIVIVDTRGEGWQLVNTYPSKKKKEHSAQMDGDTIAQSVAQSLHEADSFLQEVRTGGFEKQADKQVAKLKKTQRLLFALARRTSPSYVQEVIDAQTKNVSSVQLEPEKAYEEFGLCAERAQDIPYSYFKKIIKQERASDGTTAHRKTVLRQLEYVFANEATKQEYDAYLQGENALRKLMLSAGESAVVMQQLNTVIQRIQDLQDVRNAVTRASKNLPADSAREQFFRLE